MNIPLSLTRSTICYMFRFFSFLLLAFGLLLSSCSVFKQSTQSDHYIELQESPVIGHQMPYSIKVFTNGKFYYLEKGEKALEGKLDSNSNDLLWKSIEKAALQELKDSYVKGAEDSPPATLHYHSKDADKSIVFQQMAPDAVKKIAGQLKKIAARHRNP